MRPLVPTAAGALILLTGCLTSTQATRLQTDLDEVKRQLFQIQQDGAATRSRVDEIDRRMAAGGASPAPGQADLQAAVQTLLDQVQALRAQLDDINTRLTHAAPAGGVNTGGGFAAPPASTPMGEPAAPGSQAFNAAYADYSKGNYELATMGFEEFMRSSPSSPLAGDAQYWIGECLYSQGKFGEAVEAFDRVVTLYPGSDKAPAAMLKKGYALIESGQTTLAVTALQQLTDAHPDSDEARLAEERLRRLGLRAP